MRINSPVALDKGLRATFMQYFAVDTQMVDQLAYVVPSNSDQESHEYMGFPPQMSELVGPLEFTPVTGGKYTVINKTFASAMEVGRNMLADNQTGSILTRVKQLASVASAHVIKSMIDLIVNGASGLAYDGVAFFSAATGNRAFTNTTAGSGVTASAIQADLAAAKARILKRTADNGEPMFPEGLPVEFYVGYPMELEFVVLQAINSTLVNNTTNVMAGFAKPIPIRRTTDANDLFLFASAPGIKPLLVQPREDMTFESQQDASSDTYFREEKLAYKARYRAGYAYGLPQAADRITN